jgi:hypothetical protein
VSVTGELGPAPGYVLSWIVGGSAARPLELLVVLQLSCTTKVTPPGPTPLAHQRVEGLLNGGKLSITRGWIAGDVVSAAQLGMQPAKSQEH